MLSSGGGGGSWRQCHRLLIAGLILSLASVSLVIIVHSADAAATTTTTTTTGSNGQDSKRLLDTQLEKALTPTANSSLLYECELSYMQMDMSLIKFSINYLQLIQPAARQSEPFKLPEISEAMPASQIAYASTLNASLPFIFFINGFNTFGPSEDINATWMYDVARNFAMRPAGAAAPANNDGQSLERNVVFLTWSIPNLFANNLLSMIPAYYKTVANYDLIMQCVTRTLAKLIAFVDATQRFDSAQERLDYFRRWHFYGHSLGSHILSDAISRVVAIASFGSPSNVANFVAYNKTTTTTTTTTSVSLNRLKFGKLVGLDPATPCFVSREYGISSEKVAQAVREVLVLHSNAGFAGVPNERANLEIVLNGGTFQPGCSWYDFTCHHVRSTDILSYMDDECQMVAYKCSSYHHFKLGACETCYDGASQATSTTSSLASTSKLTPSARGYERLARNCILVNLPEQHRDSRAILEYAEQFNDEQRQLAELARGKLIRSGQHHATSIELFRHLEELERHARELEALEFANKSAQALRSSRTASGELALIGSTSGPTTKAEPATASTVATSNKARKAYYHFVSTSPNFRFGRKTHCLQHYQLRLLIYSSGDGGGGGGDNGPSNATSESSLREKCKLSSFYVRASDELRLKLYYEDVDLPAKADENKKKKNKKRLNKKLVLDSADPRQMSSSIKLTGIIKDLFHTSLINFEGAPKLFTGAQLDNIDLSALSECIVKESAAGQQANATPAASSLNFVLDVAFMSHTNYKIRHAYSSVLCGQLDLPSARTRSRSSKASATKGNNSAATNKQSSSSSSSGGGGGGGVNATDGNVNYNLKNEEEAEEAEEEGQEQNLDLMLRLCKRSDLKDVSAQIDKLLAHMKLHRLDETWKVSLLNSLFSLFIEWEPF